MYVFVLLFVMLGVEVGVEWGYRYRQILKEYMVEKREMSGAELGRAEEVLL